MFMKRKKILSWSLAISLLLGGGGISYAKVTGVCSNCHTIHNSQGGETLEASGPYELLLKGDCVGCHTGDNDGGSTPYVMSTTEPDFGIGTEGGLAGGSFFWVAQTIGGYGDACGHNVMGIAGQDEAITVVEGAPGGQAPCAGSCHMTLAVAQTSIPTLGSGCQGCHLNVMHHTDEGTGTKYVGASPWYRFLSGHQSGTGKGVVGIEDSDWQFTKSMGDHNEYLGVSGPKTSKGGFDHSGNTTTAFCTGCHGNFHQQDLTDTGASPWLRHPSDSVIPNSGEYAFRLTPYNLNVPVARDAATMTTLGNSPGSSIAAGKDMVMCLSCHVAHGSPYPDMLRFDYSLMNAGAGGGSSGRGCFTCHTTKD